MIAVRVTLRFHLAKDQANAFSSSGKNKIRKARNKNVNINFTSG
jgi:lipid II:glycine glycyltransferase (peptidoglycan interpeptide bridge formation enzyme)